MKPILKLGNITSKVPKDFYRLCFFFGGKNHFSSSVTRCSSAGNYVDWARLLLSLIICTASFIHLFIFLPSTISIFWFFFGGGVLGKFLACFPRGQKGVSKFFACGGLFSIVEGSENRWIFEIYQTIVKFMEKRTPKFFCLRRSILRKVLGQSEGAQKHTWIPPPLTGYAGCHP